MIVRTARCSSLGLLAVLVSAASRSAQDSLAAVRADVGRAVARLDADHGKLWGIRLDTVPWLFVHEHRIVLTADPHQDGYPAVGNLWTGALPSGLNPANTSVTWAGRRWAMVILPLPEDTTAAVEQLIHEVWHVVQPRALPLPQYNEATSGADLLERPEGRLWLQLEWRALARGLTASDNTARRAALADALTFRARRYADATPEERTRETLLDLAEGMAEYTGWKLGGATPAALGAALREDAPHRPSFVRTFPYFTGPAYAMMLDVLGQRGWIEQLRRAPDLQAAAARALGRPWPAPVADAERAAARYGLDSLRASEATRWDQQVRLLASLRARFVDGATLRIRPGALQVSFDYRRNIPLGDAGTVMANLTWRAADGSAALDAPGGALVPNDWSDIRVPLDTVQPVAGVLDHPVRWIGNGWSLTLPAGWRLAQAGTSWVATPQD